MAINQAAALFQNFTPDILAIFIKFCREFCDEELDMPDTSYWYRLQMNTYHGGDSFIALGFEVKDGGTPTPPEVSVMKFQCQHRPTKDSICFMIESEYPDGREGAMLLTSPWYSIK